MSIFIINEDLTACTKESFAKQPIEPKFKPSADARALTDRRRKELKYKQDIANFNRTLNRYTILGYTKSSGITSLKDIIGKEVEGELREGQLYINKTIS